jgi:hypothetical protein
MLYECNNMNDHQGQALMALTNREQNFLYESDNGQHDF